VALPATVLIMLVVRSMRRMTPFDQSATNRLPLNSAMPLGTLKKAEVAGPPSPAKRLAVLLPAMVVMPPWASTCAAGGDVCGDARVCGGHGVQSDT
jgi:hypothetical protein